MDKVLFVSPNANPGGATVWLLDFIRYVKSNSSFDIYIFLESGGALSKEFEKLGKTLTVDYYGKGLKNKYLFILNYLLRKLRRKHLIWKLGFLKPDLIYINTLHSSLLNRKLLKDIGGKYILHVHEMAFIQQLYIDDARKKIFQGASKTIAVSEAVKNSLINVCELNEQQVEVIYPPLPSKVKDLDLDSEEFRKSIGIDADSFLVLGIGSPGWVKGSDLFLQTAIQAHKKSPEIVFLWVGGDANDKEYKAFKYDIKVSEASSFVKVLPSVPVINPYYKIANLFFLSSRQDSFPLVNLEALFFNLPVVFFDKSGGTAELLSQFENQMTPLPYLDTYKAAMAIHKSITVKVQNPEKQKLNDVFDANKLYQRNVEIIESLMN